MSTNADNFRANVAPNAWEKGGLDANQYAASLGAVQVSTEPAECWDGEGQGFLWRFRDGSLALIREDGNEVLRGGANIASRIKRQFADVLRETDR